MAAGVNYYAFHLGDYALHTRHLSLLEDLAYRRMLDLYYTTEQPLPEAKETARLIGMREHLSEVESVLSDFFVSDGERWLSKRCEDEIARFKDKQSKSKAAGKASSNARSTKTEQTESGCSTDVERTLNGCSTDVQPTKNQEPRTKEKPPIPPEGGKTAIGLKAWLDAVKAKGEAPIPEGDPVFEYADSVGIPSEFLRLAWLEFRHRYTQPDAKRYRDWRGVFRKAVRGNWGKLWWLDPSCNQYALTTVGLQAQRAHQERRQA